MKRIALVLWLALLTVVSAQWIGYAQQPEAPRFTGTSVTMDGKDLSAARRHFDAGARSYWHSHDNGQLLLVEKGRMRTAKRGQTMKELGPGESDFTGPTVQHWHGAAPTQDLVQINVGFSGGTKWLEAVTDDEYAGRKK
ncbi:MAG: cupin domain-containing protein [Acidobacteria bacterium]|nr:cupin domain-containing protein [Acidobacteriota bacterium]